MGKLGATYHNDLDRLQDIEPDIVIECTGAPLLIRELLGRTAPAGIICLAGLSETGSVLDIDMDSSIARSCSAMMWCSGP